MRHLLALLGLVLMAGAPAAAITPGDPARGGELYDAKCGGCHSLDSNRVGPAHRGVYGRRAGSAPGFSYSPGFKSSKIIWSEKSLDRWLTNPQAAIAGARMGFRLDDAQDRADVIAYLRQQSLVKR